ncbi:hypothetical protein EVAR_41976_1 [Eumeta japonica]|uniref:Uncharacterized protein n=1 Tax=Eumeta variegata TaxID=151549 RepID=A0A4C1WQA2_EUMVA|nr:hypothetical protein EVAR_41976_1 [Eumeta japonica]
MDTRNARGVTNVSSASRRDKISDEGIKWLGAHPLIVLIPNPATLVDVTVCLNVPEDVPSCHERLLLSNRYSIRWMRIRSGRTHTRISGGLPDACYCISQARV